MNSTGSTAGLRRGQFSLRGLVLLVVAANLYSIFASWVLSQFMVAHVLAIPLPASLLGLWWGKRRCAATWNEAAGLAIGCGTVVAALAFATAFVVSNLRTQAATGGWQWDQLTASLLQSGLPMIVGTAYGFLVSTVLVLLTIGVCRLTSSLVAQRSRQ